MRSVLFAALVILASVPAELAAQGREPLSLADSRAARQRSDSARVLRSARSAQAAFERLRFRHLPWVPYYGTGGRCHERIGRFCLWHDDDDDDTPWKAPPEHASVTTRRERLIEELAAAAEATPGDGWVAGQRVRYLVEADRAAEAVRAARDCRAEEWWCRALQGYALHAAGEHAAAEAAFEAALEGMPEDERRDWDNLAPILDDGDARELRRLPQAQRDSLVRRLWWLADPLWASPGNDRRGEHHARLVADRLQDRARTTEGLSWGGDLREILLRYGQPIGWERIHGATAMQSSPGVVTHYAPDAYEFIPRLRLARDPSLLEPGGWKLDEPAARTSYAPAGVKSLDELPHQLAVFRRGGRAEVVAAFRLVHDSLPEAPEVEAGLVLARDELAAPVVARATVAGARGVLRASAAAEPVVVSIEARERASRRAGRARFGADLRPGAPLRLSLSDILLLADADARPATLDEAAPLARGDTRPAPGERLGLFWEIYGLQPDEETVTVSVALARTSVGGLRRAAERLGLARSFTPVRMRWSEELDGAADVLGRSLAIGIPDLPDGEYLLEVTVRTRGASASAVREITVDRDAQGR